MQAAEGKLFKPLAYTKTFALIAAAIVALTVIPPVASLLFTRRSGRGSPVRRGLQVALIIAGAILVATLRWWWAGGLLGLLGKVSMVSCEITSNCSTCGNCVPTCPTGAIKDQETVFCDPGECTMCMVCAENCPRDTVRFPFKFSKFLHQPYDIERRKALLSIGATAVGVGLLETNFAGLVQSPAPIRPPGAVNERLLSTCIRCGECSTVCPTNAIQMAVLDGGIEGFWTPVVVPRIGYCDYSCQACGQVCPVEAIPPLSLEEKRVQVIGKAEVDRNRCLPWSEDQECIVCEEMCPIPEKAIELDLVEIPDGQGGVKQLQRPVVIHNLCIGCGICENKCPVVGEAAIRVSVPSGGNHNGHQHQGRHG